MNPEDITSEAIAGTDVHNDIVVSDGQEAVGDGTNALTLEEVAKALSLGTIMIIHLKEFQQNSLARLIKLLITTSGMVTCSSISIMNFG